MWPRQPCWCEYTYVCQRDYHSHITSCLTNWSRVFMSSEKLACSKLLWQLTTTKIKQKTIIEKTFVNNYKKWQFVPFLEHMLSLCHFVLSKFNFYKIKSESILFWSFFLSFFQSNFVAIFLLKLKTEIETKKETEFYAIDMKFCSASHFG